MVDFAIPDHVTEFQKLARDFAQNEIRPAELALDAMADPEKAYASGVHAEVMAKSYEIGLNKMTIPEEHGGLGLSPFAHYVVLEELAAAGPGLTSALMVSPITPGLVANFGLGDRHPFYKEYFDAYMADVSGTHSSCWAITEPAIGSDAGEFEMPICFSTRGKPSEGGGYVIDGAKSAFVSNGWRADSILLMATVNPDQGMLGTGVFLLPGDLDGITRGRPLDKLGLRALNQAEIFFDNVEVPEEFMLVSPNPMYPMVLQNIVTGGNTAVGTLALGIARAAYEEALAYSKERKQGGKPIFEHQLIAMKLFEAYRDIEAARAMLWKSASLLDKGAGDVKLAFAARNFACNMALRVTAEMVQVFGGYGISKEYTVEKHYRDAKLLQIMDGTVEKVALGAAALL